LRLEVVLVSRKVRVVVSESVWLSLLLSIALTCPLVWPEW
jgi:hypothetical protein